MWHRARSHQSLDEWGKVDIDLAVRRAEHERKDLAFVVLPHELGIDCRECGGGEPQLAAQLRDDLGELESGGDGAPI